MLTHKDTGRIYIGQSKNLKSRLREYKNCGGSGNSNTVIKKSITKYSWDAFESKILVYCEGREYLNETEIRCIAEFNSLVPNGFNVHTGGANYGFTKKDIKAAAIANKNRVITEEYKEKQRAASKARWNNAPTEVLEKYRALAKTRNLGKKFSDEHKKKISDTRKAKIASGEIVYKKNATRPKLTEEHKKKVGDASKKMWSDPEYKVKMKTILSAAAKKRWENPKYRAKVLAAKGVC